MDKKIKKAVIAQIINMFVNDIINENGTEPFIGWCADGEVYEFLGDEDKIQKAMELTEKIANDVDNIVYKLDFK